MAKAKNNTDQTSKPIEPPPEWRKVESRADGFWDEREPICGIVESAREFVNRKNRLTRVYLIRLLMPTTGLAQQIGGGPPVEADFKTGELVGIFGSAGLRDLENRAGCKVWIRRDGVRQTKNGEMKVYDIRSPDQPSPLRIETYTPRGKEAADGNVVADDIRDLEGPPF